MFILAASPSSDLINTDIGIDIQSSQILRVSYHLPSQEIQRYWGIMEWTFFSTLQALGFSFISMVYLLDFTLYLLSTTMRWHRRNASEIVIKSDNVITDYRTGTNISTFTEKELCILSVPSIVFALFLMSYCENYCEPSVQYWPVARSQFVII